jgi:hypothetical protein
MIKADKYPELADLIKGSSYNQLFQLLYKVALLRYATPEHLKRISFKIGTVKKTARLNELGLLNTHPSGVSVITDKGLNLLKEEGYNTEPVNKKLQGTGAGDEPVIASVILDVMDEEDFYTVFYPHFDFLIPDACAIFRKDGKARLVFIEVEKKKGNWQKYLLEKKDKYERIGDDLDIYDKWWRRWSGILKLDFCPAEEFCFSVRCYSELKFDWQGWEFFADGRIS